MKCASDFNNVTIEQLQTVSVIYGKWYDTFLSFNV